jgi:hypothetical protein
MIEEVRTAGIEPQIRDRPQQNKKLQQKAQRDNLTVECRHTGGREVVDTGNLATSAPMALNTSIFSDTLLQVPFWGLFVLDRDGKNQKEKLEIRFGMAPDGDFEGLIPQDLLMNLIRENLPHLDRSICLLWDNQGKANLVIKHGNLEHWLEMLPVDFVVSGDEIHLYHSFR